MDAVLHDILNRLAELEALALPLPFGTAGQAVIMEPGEALPIWGDAFGYVVRRGKLWIGREEGPRFGLRYLDNGDGTATLALEAIDTANVAFFSASGKDYQTNSHRLRLGYEDAAHIYLELPTNTSADPEQSRRIVVQLATFEGADTATEGEVPTADGVGGVTWQPGGDLDHILTDADGEVLADANGNVLAL